MSREELSALHCRARTTGHLHHARPNGALALLPYGCFAAELRQAATLLTQAAALASDAGLRTTPSCVPCAYGDDYRASTAWLDMKDNGSM
jgi:hypothetical protein